MTVTDDRLSSLDPGRSVRDERVARTDHRSRTVTLPAFRALMALKRRAIVPMTVFYLVAYLGVMLLMGFARPMMTIKVAGSLTVGYALVLGLYAMCWIIAVLYTLMADRWFDPQAATAAREDAMASRSEAGVARAGIARPLTP